MCLEMCLEKLANYFAAVGSSSKKAFGQMAKPHLFEVHSLVHLPLKGDADEDAAQ